MEILLSTYGLTPIQLGETGRLLLQAIRLRDYTSRNIQAQQYHPLYCGRPLGASGQIELHGRFNGVRRGITSADKWINIHALSTPITRSTRVAKWVGSQRLRAASAALAGA